MAEHIIRKYMTIFSMISIEKGEKLQMKKTGRKRIFATVSMLLLLFILSAGAEQETEIEPLIISLTNLEDGAWSVVNEELHCIEISAEDDFVGEYDIHPERYYNFTIRGKQAGAESFSLAFNKGGRIVYRVQIQVNVDENMKVTIVEAEAITGEYYEAHTLTD